MGLPDDAVSSVVTLDAFIVFVPGAAGLGDAFAVFVDPESVSALGTHD